LTIPNENKVDVGYNCTGGEGDWSEPRVWLDATAVGLARNGKK
jgi:uncharacterized Zn-finger protein